MPKQSFFIPPVLHVIGNVFGFKILKLSGGNTYFFFAYGYNAFIVGAYPPHIDYVLTMYAHKEFLGKCILHFLKSYFFSENLVIHKEFAVAVVGLNVLDLFEFNLVKNALIEKIDTFVRIDKFARGSQSLFDFRPDKGLRDESEGSYAKSLLVSFDGCCGHNDDAVGISLEDILSRFNSVYSGHFDIQKDYVEIILLRY